MDATDPVHPAAALRYREFRYFQAASFAASIALQMQAVAVGYQVYEITKHPIDLGYVGLSQFVPMFLLTPITGDVADRFDRRKILLGCHAMITASALFLWLHAIGRSGFHGVAPIYVALVVFGAARGFSRPAGQALLPTLVESVHFTNAVAWSSSIWQVAAIVGPAVGGIMYAARDSASPVYVGTVVLEVVAFVLVFAMRIPPAKPAPASMNRLAAGIRYVWAKKMLLGAISLDLFAVLLGGAIALLPVFAKDILHVGAWGFGFLRSAPAIGAVITALWLAWRPIGRNAGTKMFVAVAIFGVATIVFGVSRSFPLSVIALAVLGGADMVSVVTRQTLVQIATPPEMRGRVSAVNVLFIGASNELGEFESGLTAAWLSTVPSVVIGGIGTLLVVAIWSLAFPSLRKVDRLDDLAPVRPSG